MHEDAFRLYAVCSRFPHHLAQTIPWEPLQQGVYQCRRGTDVIRVIVVRQLEQSEHNAMLHLFSASQEQLSYGRENYRRRSPNTSTLIQQLLKGYQEEGIVMPYTMENFQRDYAKEHFKDLTPEEQLEALQSLPLEAQEKIVQELQKRKTEEPPKPRKKPRRR